MFILTQMDTTTGMFGIFDSSDGSFDVVSIAVVADRIRNGKLEVKGIKPRIDANLMPLPQYGISISVAEARGALERYRHVARR